MRFNLILLLFFLFLACKPKVQEQKEGVIDSVQSNSDSVLVETTKAKLPSFNRVDQTIDKLSAIGIGKMSEWKSDSANGFTSFTPPFPIGEQSIDNIAFQIESADRNYITSLKIVLNVGNPKETRQGLAKLKDVTTKAFETLGIQMPTPLPNAILNSKAVIVDGIDYGTSLKIDSAKTSSWIVRVTTRMLP